MYITVKYGNNESILCNPSCAVINLLTSIKRRAGYGNSNVLVDLSDETGLVKELDLHRMDYATKHLQSHRTYILVEKQMIMSDEPMEPDCPTTNPTQCNYVPLLDNYTEMFPDYRLRVQAVMDKRRRRGLSKSPSPAGVRGVKAAKNVKNLNVNRAPSRKK